MGGNGGGAEQGRVTGLEPQMPGNEVNGPFIPYLWRFLLSPHGQVTLEGKSCV